MRRLFLLLFALVVPPVSTTALPVNALAADNLPALIKYISPSVVSVLNYNEGGKLLSQGSGFIISNHGDILTNRHVLEGATTGKIIMNTGKEYAISKVFSDDADRDLIRVGINNFGANFTPLKVNVKEPSVGERIVVVGNPMGLKNSVTDGIVSAIREIPRFGKIIQISAPISAGSSGSPVINMKGEVVGIATFKIIEGQNLNFAVSSINILALEQNKELTLSEWNRINSRQPNHLRTDNNIGIIVTEKQLNIRDGFRQLRWGCTIEEAMKKRTTFIIAQRLSTIKNADKILVFDNGHIIEFGTHEELISKKGAYKTIYETQFLEKSPTSKKGDD